jgi:Tfp pilus assembly protein PilF
MKNLLSGFILLLLIPFIQPAHAQDDVKSLHETARTFMRAGDFDNAILVLKRALQKESSNLDLQKDLVMSYYLKRDFKEALAGVEALTERDDADVITFQIAGNVYKALEEVKEAEKLYKKALKKFPNSGPLRSEYGELLWALKDFSAIDQWEMGIKSDPAYGGNYYNAAQFYFYTKDKVWSLIYAEIFVNMESLSERGSNLKQLLLQGYKEKLFSDVDLMKGQEDIKSGFAKAFLSTMQKQSGLADKGLNTEKLTMIRTRFILDWYNSNSARYPFKLFDYQRQLLQEGLFEAYNQWLFGPDENLAAYDNWTKTHPEQHANFANFQKSRVFRMPNNQYYQVR